MDVPFRSPIKEYAMKKNVCIHMLNAAAALSLLAPVSSCTEIRVDIGSETGTYIEFASALTKAPVNSASDITEFAVWAYYQAADGSCTDVFGQTGTENTGITVSRTGGSWTYENPKMWEFGVTYTFYGIYPADTEGVSMTAAAADENPHIVMENYSILSAENAGEDLMLAVDDGINYPEGSDTAPVSLRFTHLLSMVDLVCRPYGSQADWPENYKPEVHSVKLYGIGSEATFRSAGFIPGNIQSIRRGWTVDASAATTESSPYADAGITAPVLIDTETNLLKDVMVFPQTFAPGMRIGIEYTASKDSPVRNTVMELISLPLEAWEAGKHYVYTFTISPEGRIIFEVPDVRPWEDASGGIIIIE